MNNIFGNGEEIFDIDEVSGGTAYQFDSHYSFKPWHKPRKQFVRDKQWWFHLSFLLSRFPIYNDIRTIKYFGLPGEDLLDISYFSKKLSQDLALKNKEIQVHGFIDNETGKQNADIRMSELLDRNNISKMSAVEKFNFHALAKEQSLALRKVKSNGAYHLINLDFCDAVFKQETIDSMMELLGIQFDNMLDTPWLFFLTTRADRSGISEELLSNLDRIFTESISSDGDFVAALEEYRERIFELARDKRSFSEEMLSESDLSEVLQACFIYWLIKLTHQHESRMESVSIMKYKVHGGNDFPDMFSYVFRFTKKSLAKKDSLGLAKSTSGAKSSINEVDKISDKKSAVEKLSTSLDIDAHLLQHSEIYNFYANEMKELLNEIGVDTSRYDESSIS
ncbi:PP_RS20740 family protein [Shewanella algae]|jgi:hypothetical protein|uniref:PP_RS20740 family protein n=1 Tax=Shewanella algae TaxID=38313 RepID=UPI0030049EF8